MEEIIKMYCDEGKSIREISRITSFNKNQIGRFLKNSGVLVLEPNKLRNLIGQEFGDLKVISRALNRKKRVRWNCDCKCGKKCIVRMDLLIRGEQISCGKCKTHKEICGHYWATVRYGAKNRGIEFDISVEDAWEVFEKQQNKCAISGVDLEFSNDYKNSTKQTASLDRIDSSFGYIKGNIQWVHKDVNYMKQDYNQSYFIETCNNISRFNSNKNDLTILVTGTGYLGSVLIEMLLSKFPKCKIIGYDNLFYKQDGLIPFFSNKNFEFVLGDVRDTEKLLQYVRKADVIFPLAAIVGFPACDKDPILAHQVNFEHILNITKVLSKNQMLISPCTNSGYGANITGICTEESPMNPISVYGKTKCMAEKVILENTNGISLRLATLFGTSYRMRLDLLVNDFTYKAVNDGYIVLFEKNFKRNYVHVRDVVNAFIFMMDNYQKLKNNVFNVGLSDANLTKEQLCFKIKNYVNNFSIKEDNIREDPDKRDYIVSNEKIEKTGFKFMYSLDDGIKELIKAYKIIKPTIIKYGNF